MTCFQTQDFSLILTSLLGAILRWAKFYQDTHLQPNKNHRPQSTQQSMTWYSHSPSKAKREKKKIKKVVEFMQSCAKRTGFGSLNSMAWYVW